VIVPEGEAMLPTARVSLLPLLLVAVAGCDSGPEVYPVSGTVSFNDKPVEGANVAFMPVAEQGVAAAGKTDADGRFELQMGEEPGAQEGQYKVVVQLIKIVGKRTNPDSDDNLKSVYLIPQKYSDPQTSGLTAEVPSDTYDFKLTR
jgi:hypothetical protein